MEILLNKGIGGFSFPSKFCKLFFDTFGFDLAELCIDDDGDFSYGLTVRTDTRILNLFKSNPALFKTSDLEIEFLNASKDFYIEDIDGSETLKYIK